MAEEKKGPAESRYYALTSDREQFLQRARDAAKVTIPSLFPPSGRKNAKLKTPHQALGARGVNNLAAKLLLALFPPNANFFRLRIDEAVEDEAQAQQPQGEGNMKTDIEKALSKVERIISGDSEKNADRVVLFETLKHLIVGGNGLLHDNKQGLRLFHLDNYVCRRDPMGEAVEIVVHEQVYADALPKDFYERIKAKIPKSKNSDGPSKELNLYTHLVRKQDKWEVYQEVCGERVPKSFGTYPVDACPWIPLRLTRMAGEDYGRSYVEEYQGDLEKLETLMLAIADAAAASAKVIILVDPNGMTRVKTIANSPNGIVAEGKKEDVSVVQLDKFADLNVAKDVVNMISERLSFAFMLNSSVQRQAERVTAEEVRYMAGELEDALGGVYSILAVELQLPYVSQKMARLQKEGKIPPLPKGAVRPTIITGMEALGRGYDKNKLVGFLTVLSQVFGPEALKLYIEPTEGVKRLALADGIDTQGLVKTQDQITQGASQEQIMGLVHKLGPQAISTIGGKMMDQQAAQQQAAQQQAVQEAPAQPAEPQGVQQ